MHGRTIDRTNLRYGRLVAINLDPVRGPLGTLYWNCLCDCGNHTRAAGGNLARGFTTSCGCYSKEVTSEVKTKHGVSNSPTYISWQSMKNRCTNPNEPSYQLYGARGITVCNRWLESFENFLEDMGERPEGTSINRINGAKTYSKENCEWATFSVQSYDTDLSRNNTSGKTGVSERRPGKWVAYIDCGKRIHLGTFLTREGAVKARQAAELKYYGFTKQ